MVNPNVVVDRPPAFWALDSKCNELDPQLKPAQQEALREHMENNHNSNNEDDETVLQEPLILKNLLNLEQIEEILTKACADGFGHEGSMKQNERRENSRRKNLVRN